MFATSSVFWPPGFPRRSCIPNENENQSGTHDCFRVPDGHSTGKKESARMICEGIRRARADVHQRHWTRPPKNGPGIITAVQEQIGLKLSPVKLPLDMVSKTKKAHCRAPATLRKGSVSNQCRAGSRYFERATRSGFRDDESPGNAHREFVWPVQPFQNRNTDRCRKTTAEVNCTADAGMAVGGYLGLRGGLRFADRRSCCGPVHAR